MTGLLKLIQIFPRGTYPKALATIAALPIYFIRIVPKKALRFYRKAFVPRTSLSSNFWLEDLKAIAEYQ